ncbi:hypothetical protein cce_2866 [Crocosphaera subtropica ATCC 51142]|uniref:Addiction module killer protein n=2 Tax=Crocosphaera TaxID=263510 RepID=B1WV17_CROS5|nr:hypothetical protein cce_2866 [Crocosphaera subtropica ATCC 51142]
MMDAKKAIPNNAFIKKIKQWLLPIIYDTTQAIDGYRNRFTNYLTRIQQGNFSRVESVGEGVFECRIDFGPGYRVYFGQEGEVIIILLTGGIKKDNKKISNKLKNFG